jgi:hypothetical protein
MALTILQAAELGSEWALRLVLEAQQQHGPISNWVDEDVPDSAGHAWPINTLYGEPTGLDDG